MNITNLEYYPADLHNLRALVTGNLKPKMQAVDVGCYCGAGAILAMLPYVQAMGGNLLCVDRFDAREGMPDREHAMHSNLNVYELLTHNIAAAGYTNEVMIAKGDSLNAAKVVPNRSQDWIYIDADHSYYAVRADIEAWSDKVKLGGILCGHDYDRHHPGVVEAADEIGADSTGRIWWKTIGEGE